MAVPTTDELYDFFTQLMDRSGNPHAVFEREHLVTSGFRYFKSKGASIERVMKELLDDGRLVGVRINDSGYVHLDHKELTDGLFTLYFQYSGGMRYGSEDWGPITHERAKDHDKVWRSGTRRLYTTGPRFERMLADFMEAKKRYDERRKEVRKEEEHRAQNMLNAITSDATQLLERLESAVPGINTAVRVGGLAASERLFVGVDLMGVKEIGPFFDILRRGLPDVPRETSDTGDE